MVNSRYVHLHEALGLGVMWLPQGWTVHAGSEIVNGEKVSRSAVATPSHSAARADVVDNQNKAKRHNVNLPARLAALQHVRAHAPETPNHDPAPVTVVSAPPPVLLGSKPKPAQVAALCVCASPADIVAGRLLSGAAGDLFDKMLDAIQLSREQVYLSCWLKQLPDFNPDPPADLVAAAVAPLAGELAAVRPQALLLMGRFFEREDVRRHLHTLAADVPAFYIAHPQQMVADAQLKRPAWATLQQLQTTLSQN
ncbi:hypothetical protein LNQ82_03050 [Conchiformibius steedae DSM 2580]|uniref:Uracil-DNA glycosylase-like domain-containing protein n=1 Tax=Conchiformibius steedae DSM 2580 TaxID=1121352 RepID=A0AAE9HX06_9NEIS|nr:uracil-DNA glycosylase family protein [Conchiformibius steedae]QMT33499.1 hypothetical protein H3L98_10575 [Conchiformibius steedae]URD68156.1 hypothetical protein LNQ82_03050 [Conchiformibius steedae DSM 2580]